MIRYLDDHLILGLGLVETNKLLDNLLVMMARLDIPVKDFKTIRATKEVKFIVCLLTIPEDSHHL